MGATLEAEILGILLRMERRLTAHDSRLRALEKKKPKFEFGEFLKGAWGKGLIILALLAAQMPLKDAILAVLK